MDHCFACISFDVVKFSFSNLDFDLGDSFLLLFFGFLLSNRTIALPNFWPNVKWFDAVFVVTDKASLSTASKDSTFYSND